MKEQLISIVIALVFSIIGALLGVFFPKDFQAIDSLYFGLFAYLTSTLAITHWNSTKLEKIDDIALEVKYTANHLKIQDAAIRNGSRSFDLFWALSLLRAKEGVYTLLDSGEFIVSREQAPKFWLQAIINTDSSWLGTNVVASQRDWQSGWEVKGIKYQKLVYDLSSITTKRVFIFDSTSDISANILSMMEKHQEHNIQVKWTSKNIEDQQWMPFDFLQKTIGALDFVIIDGRYLLLFNLEDDKSLSSIRCTDNEHLVSSIIDIYMRLWEEARVLSEIKVT